ncbi:SPARC-like protein 1 isoform X2 [Oxyura jamaicensis]|uniref:SPARC-like protein 1 isoform X2 n=1 Tax=Oxyura jamaicensis TaxID=8884 RepID=UPI0015A6EFDD|nr:SPARC-like protein 1 isoform X2 [Oxyura jamaicensis]
MKGNLQTLPPYHYWPVQEMKTMKTLMLLICLLGSASAIPTKPIHSEAQDEGKTRPANEGDLQPSHRNIKAKGKPGLTSDSQESDSGSSGRERSSSDHYQLRRHEKHSNTANQALDAGENPVDALNLDHEHNAWKYNKNTVGLSENNSESDEEENVEEEGEEWGEVTDYRDMKHKAHRTSHGNQYRRQQKENSRQSDEILRDSSQPIQITKRHSEKFSIEEEEESQEKPYKEEKIPLSKKSHNEDEDEKWQSQETKDSFQVNHQSDHGMVMKRQDKEGSNVDKDDIDSGDDGEEDLSNAWKEAAYEEEERIQRNDQDSTSNEPEGEGTTGDDSAVHRERWDHRGVKIKDLTHSEHANYHYEVPNSNSKQQLQTSGPVQSMNSMEPVDEVKTTGSSYSARRSASNSTGEAFLDPCRNFHCKRGKVCQADRQGKPGCICQDPAACPSTKDYERVCGTDNKTYDGTCQLFGTKCQLEGTKMGRQLHLDYMGSCKYIPNCTDYEVDQFPLRMRDWLKNILMQYYERDQDTTGFLTEKQRNKVKKIYQNEKRLMAGNHSAELLLHDFEKNYHMYVYPVHWQFYQLDQHPADRSLMHSELAPLRASLVPMEHCITRFFQECDRDQDKLIALKEWCHCFGIKEEDINENLLF